MGKFLITNEEILTGTNYEICTETKPQINTTQNKIL